MILEPVDSRSHDTLVTPDHSGGPPQGPRYPKFGDSGDNGSGGGATPSTANAYLAMALFIGADVMFFAGLIGALIVFKFGAQDWPPVGLPKLPLGVTVVNTAILLASGYAMIRTWKHLRNWPLKRITKSLFVTVALGVIFLCVQGFEWMRLLRFGLTISSTVFGGIFYVLIGCHAMHVFAGALWMVVVLIKTASATGISRARQHLRIKLAGMYWLLVVALWPILFGLVYLN